MSEFILSQSDVRLLPKTGGEIALWGRSNVGKSSLINAILGKRLARTSSLPGKTRTINLFRTNHKEVLVDLPGYSYAKVSKTTKNYIDTLLSEYIVKREELLSILLIIDSKVGPTDQDEEIINYLRESGRGYHILLSKSDKATQSQLQATLRRLRECGVEQAPLVTSSRSGENIQGVRKLITSVFIEHKSRSKYAKI